MEIFQKKVLHIILGLILTLALTGCGSGSDSEDTTTPPPPTTEPPTTTPPTTPPPCCPPPVTTPPANTPPTITILGDNPMTVIACDTYVEQNATANDVEDGDLTSSITKSGTVNTSTVGTYTITYAVTDSDGNSVSADRTVEVILTRSTSPVVHKTGQTISYDNSGADFVADCNYRDDGFYKAGAARAFVRDTTNETVTDNVTGLVWEDGDHTKPDDTNSGDPKLLNQSDAKTYCDGLTFGGRSDWRLPEVWELLTITDKIKFDTATDSTFVNFSNYAQGWTYSSTPIMQGGTPNGSYWIVNFKTGVDVDDISNSNYSVRCVSGSSPINLAKTYTKDATTKIVASTTTGLEWADDDLTLRPTLDWGASINFCEALDAGGQTDWRLPNINEYYSIFDYTINAIDPANFTIGDTEKMWSSTTAAPGYVGLDSAWVMKQQRGDSTPISKALSQPFMCVRNQ